MVQVYKFKYFLIVAVLNAVVLGSLTACSNVVPNVSVLRSEFDNSRLAVAVKKTKVKVQESTQVDVIGGVEPYTFVVLEQGLGSIDGSGLYTAPASTSQGNKATIRATDRLGQSSQVEVFLYDEMALKASVSKMAVNNESKIEISGGVPPYTFSVPAGAGVVDGTGVYKAPSSAGTYEIEASDSLGNKVRLPLTVMEALKISPGEMSVVFFAQKIDFSATGGVPPYNFFIVEGSGNIDMSTGFYNTQPSPGAVKVRVVDSLNNTSEVDFTLKPAVVTVSSPAPETYITEENQSPFIISGSCSQSGFPVTLSVAGVTQVPAPCVSGSYSHSLDATSIPDGNVLVQVGQEGAQTVQLNLKKDTVAPMISILSPIPFQAFSGSVTVSGKCSENGEKVFILLGKDEDFTVVGETLCSVGGFTQTVTISSVVEGAFQVAAVTFDAAENMGFTLPINLVKDSVAPTAPSSLKLSSAVSMLSESPSIQWSASTDLTSGVSYYLVEIYNSLDVKIATEVAVTNNIKIQNLSLIENTQYKVKVRAVDYAQNMGPYSSFSSLWKASASTCPSNYILVPTQAGSTFSDFCIAKYEMKTDGSGKAVSVASGYPWLLPRDSNEIPYSLGAQDACKANGTGYDLVSNHQWNIVAKNIASVKENWSNGIAYSGSLNRGHVFNAPSAMLAASTDDMQGCFGVEMGCTSAKRTHKLSNGVTIWDFGGNSWEWVLGTMPSTIVQGPVSEFVVNSDMHLSYGTSQLCSMPNQSPYCGYGSAIFLSGGSYDAVIRGGGFNSDISGGVFAAFLGRDPTYLGSFTGFRCVYNPN